MVWRGDDGLRVSGWWVLVFVVVLVVCCFVAVWCGFGFACGSCV